MPNRAWVLFIALALVGTGCVRKDEWKSFYYPDGNDLSTVIISPTALDSLEECREIVDFNRRALNPGNERHDDYECGKNCKVQDASSDLYICEETVE
ncbi:hypothetical protein M0Q28_01595 [Patescibacteria group bacterium]|jgi:hypothetical protein|nr:hypothetical protein [Patescibacteria group bacterium]